MSDAGGPVDLHHATFPADLDAALDLVAEGISSESGTVMWWSPTVAHWERHPGRPDGNAFELRAFDGDVEIRWLRTRTGGTVTVLATDLGRESFGGHLVNPWTPTNYVNHLPASYILWGEASANGRLTEARIGTTDLPVVEPQPGQRYQLNALEYVAIDPETGTAFVAEERLVGITQAAPPPPSPTTGERRNDE